MNNSLTSKFFVIFSIATELDEKGVTANQLSELYKSNGGKGKNEENRE